MKQKLFAVKLCAHSWLKNAKGFMLRFANLLGGGPASDNGCKTLFHQLVASVHCGLAIGIWPDIDHVKAIGIGFGYKRGEYPYPQ